MATFDVGSRFVRKAVGRRVVLAMKAKIVIIRGELGTMDPDTLIVGGLENALTIYSGKARIRTVSSAGTLEVSEGTIPLRSVVMSIPISSAVPHVDDCVVVGVDDLADSDLDTRIFRILEVDGGAFFGDARRFTTQGWYESRYWSGS
jgi:hypothetical protein